MMMMKAVKEVSRFLYIVRCALCVILNHIRGVQNIGVAYQIVQKSVNQEIIPIIILVHVLKILLYRAKDRLPLLAHRHLNS